jgi:hypothetical protein
MARRRTWIVVGAVAVVLAGVGGGWWWRRHRGPRRGGASTTTLVLRVHDAATGAPLGARVLLFDRGGAALHIGNLDLYGKRQATTACKIAPGVLGSWDGLILGYGAAEVPIGGDACVPSPAIPYGHYKVWAWRGIEHERWEGEVELGAGRGRVELDIPLERAWSAPGTLAADLHVHAAASNDSTVPNPQRVIAQVAAGVQVIGLSDHNSSGDLDAEIHELGLDGQVASIASNELTADVLHLGVYPVPFQRGAPHGGGPPPETLAHATVQQLFDAAHAFPGHPIVQVNHPRFRVYSLFDTAGWNGVAWPPPFPLAFDAVEVLSGHTAFNMPNDRRIDDSVRDLYTFTDHGFLVAPLGNSDTHHLNGVHDALTRTYVFVDDPRTAPFDEAGFVDAIRARRVACTSGPWLDVEVSRGQGQTPTVGPGQAVRAAAGGVWLDVTLHQARFVHADHLRIVVGTPTGPQVFATIPVAPDQRTTRWQGRVEVGAVDTWVGVDAGGEQVLPIEQTGTYQLEKGRKGVTPFALIAPILIDADGDGRWRRGQGDVRVP